MDIRTNCIHCKANLPIDDPDHGNFGDGESNVDKGVFGIGWDKEGNITCEGDHCCACYDDRHYNGHHGWMRLVDKPFDKLQNNCGDYFLETDKITAQELYDRAIAPRLIFMIDEVPV